MHVLVTSSCDLLGAQTEPTQGVSKVFSVSSAFSVSNTNRTNEKSANRKTRKPNRSDWLAKYLLNAAHVTDVSTKQ